MHRSTSILTACLTLAALAHAASAATFALNGQSYTTQFNTGSGPDHALMVLEYNSVASTYAFGYSWDPASGPKTGYDMLNAIIANSAGNMSDTISMFDLGDGNGPVPFVDTVSYLTNQPLNHYPDSWLSYSNADNGGPWTDAQDGAFLRPLANGSADDWVHQNIGADSNFNAQVLPTFVIPEPASLALLGIGALALLARRRTVG